MMKLLSFLLLISFHAFAQTDSLHFSPQTDVLYRNCMNILRLEGEGIDFSQLRVVCDSCEWKQNKVHPEKLGIVTNHRTKYVKIAIFEGDRWIGEKEFTVIHPPKPEKTWTISGKKIKHQRQFVSKGTEIIYSFFPDKNFAKQCPLDTHYKIDSIEFFVQYDLKPSFSVGKMCYLDKDSEKGIFFYIPDKAYEYPEGSKVCWAVKREFRINYKGDLIEDNLFTTFGEDPCLKIKK